MAVRTSFTAGEVLAAADLTDTFASKPPFAYGTATPSTTVEGFIWYDENHTPPTAKFWDGSAFQNIAPPSGLVHINTTTFTTQSSVIINNVFTSTYQNYRILINFVNSTATENYIRLRASGTDNTSTVYTYQRIFGFGTSTNALIEENINTWAIMPGTTVKNIAGIDIVEPQTAANTAILTTGFRGNAAGVYGGYHNSASSFDGFTLYPGTGTVTGTIRIYGYKNS